MSTTRPDASVEAGGFAHLGLLYGDTQSYVAATTSFVKEALAAEEPVLVAVPTSNLALIREGLSADGAEVAFADMSEAGRNPGRILPGVLLDFAGRHPGRRVSIIGEPVWPGRTAVEYPACVTHEALINTAFARRDATILCPYDRRGLPAEALDDAYRTHPQVIDETGERQVSTAYDDPARTAASLNLPLPPPAAEAAVFSYHHRDQLRQIRELVSGHADRAGLAPERVADFTIAVNELVSNTLEHTDGPGRLRLWTEPGAVVSQVEDTGHLADPLIGRVLPPPRALRGRGLVLVNQLCDLVRAYTRPGHTTIRVYAYLTDHH